MNEVRPAIVFERHPARHGIAWLREAAAMLAAARVRWLMLLLVYYLIQLMVSVVPVIGPLAMMIVRPVFTVGFLAAAWTQQRGGVPEIGHLFRGFNTNLRALLPIGLVLVGGTTLAVLATALVDGGALLDAITANGKPDEPLAVNGRVEAAMLFGIACALPTLLAVWFAPALVVFQDCGARQALGTSLRAATANWRPLAVYGLLLFFYGAVLPGIAVALIAVVVPSGIAPYVIALTVVPYIFLFVAAQAISDYVAYRDIFHGDDSREAPAADSGPS
ncbi:MAG: BPSS1780 family membrane protein [Betaproteobacteria bacterium]